MKAVIVGAGRLGIQIAEAMTASGHDVTLVEIDSGRLAAVPSGVAARLVAGDGCEPYVLEAAGALNADVVIAGTWDDEDNLVISLLAKRQFGVAKVVARVNDPDNGWLFDSRWGVDAAIPSAASIISLIEEATESTDTVSLLRLGKAGVNLVETAIGAQSSAVGRALSELELPEQSVVAAVIRDEAPIVPNPSFELRVGDEVLIISQAATEAQIHAAFQ
ncbi:potassium channel family protein [Flindersiella endophytica]